jgi:hypothetical protein
MLKCDGGKPESQACREHKHNTAPNQAIPAMTAGRTAAEFSLVTVCFESIRQLLPTFKRSAWSGRLNPRHSMHPDAITVPLPGVYPSQNEGDVGLIGTMLADLAFPCTKYLREYRSAEFQAKPRDLVACQPEPLKTNLRCQSDWCNATEVPFGVEFSGKSFTRLHSQS